MAQQLLEQGHAHFTVRWFNTDTMTGFLNKPEDLVLEGLQPPPKDGIFVCGDFLREAGIPAWMLQSGLGIDAIPERTDRGWQGSILSVPTDMRVIETSGQIQSYNARTGRGLITADGQEFFFTRHGVQQASRGSLLDGATASFIVVSKDNGEGEAVCIQVTSTDGCPAIDANPSQRVPTTPAPAEEAEGNGRATGYIHNLKASFGFITPNGEGANLLFHYSELGDGLTMEHIRPGDHVSYYTGTYKGRLCAMGVMLDGKADRADEAPSVRWEATLISSVLASGTVVAFNGRRGSGYIRLNNGGGMVLFTAEDAVKLRAYQWWGPSPTGMPVSLSVRTTRKGPIVVRRAQDLQPEVKFVPQDTDTVAPQVRA